MAWHGSRSAQEFFLGLHGTALAQTCAGRWRICGPGGTYPISELRLSSYKNNRMCYLPEHLIVRNCMIVMNEDTTANDEGEHSYVSERSLYCVKQLAAYSDALKQVRASGAADLEPYPNGM